FLRDIAITPVGEHHADQKKGDDEPAGPDPGPIGGRRPVALHPVVRIDRELPSTIQPIECRGGGGHGADRGQESGARGQRVGVRGQGSGTSSTRYSVLSSQYSPSFVSRIFLFFRPFGCPH